MWLILLTTSICGYREYPLIFDGHCRWITIRGSSIWFMMNLQQVWIFGGFFLFSQSNIIFVGFSIAQLSGRLNKLWLTTFKLLISRIIPLLQRCNLSYWLLSPLRPIRTFSIIATTLCNFVVNFIFWYVHVTMFLYL